ncbi:hypothetical protein [Brevibacterium aurantiacum]|nr:hypothetical protein [Brevibacterium aurantiacum]
MANAINFYPASRSRHVDIVDAKGIIIKIFNGMRGSISDHYLGPEGPGDPEALFIFGGYSWKLQEFKIWTLHYDREIDCFTFRPCNPWPGQDTKASQGRVKKISWIGDKPAIDDAKSRIEEILRERGTLTSGGFDMEPLEVLRDIIRSAKYDSIGGAPQVAKVYRSMQTQHFAVRWPDSDGRPHATGRPALEFENFDLPVIDIEMPHVHSRKSRQIHLS